MIGSEPKDLVAVLDLSYAFVRSLNGEIYFWSSGCQNLYGYNRQEATGRNAYQLLDTRFPESEDAVRFALATSGHWSGNLLHRTKDNRVISVASHLALQASTSLVVDECIDAGSIESHLASIVDSTNDAIIGETLDGIVTTWNPAAQRLFEYTSAEIIGQPVELLFPSTLHNEETRLIAKIQRGESVRHYETTRVTKSGRTLDISLTLSPIFDQTGRLVGISKIARDITAERAHKREIYLALERQRLAAEAGEVGLWNFNPSSSMMEWNDRHKILFGLGANAASPTLQAFLLMVHPDDEPSVRNAFQQVIEGKPEMVIDYRIVRSDGVVRWITTTGKQHTGPDHLDFSLLGTSIDLTRRRLDEEALRRANASLEEFAYAAAHDLQEPLRNISLSLQELAFRGSELEPHEPAELMNVAIKNANRMQTLIRDLLSFTRATDATGQTIPWADAAEVLSVALENLFHAIQERNAHIKIEAHLPQVPMHPSHLLQVFQNLIGNALRYAKPAVPPLIRVSGWRQTSQVVLAIADNGIGIAPQHHSRVFGVFKRLDHSHEGNGIGLAVCKRIVEHYGGRIWIQSEEGTGATFCFSVPHLKNGIENYDKSPHSGSGR